MGAAFDPARNGTFLAAPTLRRSCAGVEHANSMDRSESMVVLIRQPAGRAVRPRGQLVAGRPISGSRPGLESANRRFDADVDVRSGEARLTASGGMGSDENYGSSPAFPTSPRCCRISLAGWTHN